MEIILTHEESEEHFYNSLCNAVGTNYMIGYGLEMECDEEEYKKAKNLLIDNKKDCCYEDILMQVLRSGGKLTFTDVENDGDMTRSITLADVHEKVAKTPQRHLFGAIQGNDDATTADVILQSVFYGDVIFS